MTLLIAGLAAFFAAHSFSIFRGARAALIERIGEMPYKGVYSLLSLGGLVLIVMGYGDAARVDLWAPPAWMRYVTMALMLPVFVLLIAANVPGYIKAKLGNPMLLGVKTWAFAHLLANGDLASVVLFGTFLAWVVWDLIAVKRTGRSSVVAEPRAGFDVMAVVLGLAVYALLVFWAHPYVSGVALVAPA